MILRLFAGPCSLREPKRLALVVPVNRKLAAPQQQPGSQFDQLAALDDRQRNVLRKETQPCQTHQVTALDRIGGSLFGGQLLPRRPAVADQISEMRLAVDGPCIGGGVNQAELNPPALERDGRDHDDRIAKQRICIADTDGFGKDAAIELNPERVGFDRYSRTEMLERVSQTFAFTCSPG